MGVTLKVFNFSEVMICPWKEETEGPLQVDHKRGGLWRILPLSTSFSVATEEPRTHLFGSVLL